MTQEPLGIPRGYILAHRGLWKTGNEPNSETALRDALECGFGLETDVRDREGTLVISHDPAHGKELDFSSFLGSVASLNQLIALNIKADGLATAIAEQTSSAGPANYFVFDMSFPQARAFAELDIPLAARVSEFESPQQSRVGPYSTATYLWIDCFETDWFLADSEIDLAMHGRTSVLVSPEIHRRDPEAAWNWILGKRSSGHRVGLCTDLPLEFDSWQTD